VMVTMLPYLCCGSVAAASTGLLPACVIASFKFNQSLRRVCK
jgi:hypothetical protein